MGSDLHHCKWQSICHLTQRLGPWWADFFLPSCSSGSYPQASAEEQTEISVSLLSAEIYNMIVQVDLGVRYGDSWKYRE